MVSYKALNTTRESIFAKSCQTFRKNYLQEIIAFRECIAINGCQSCWEINILQPIALIESIFAYSCQNRRQLDYLKG